jgi:hypothetical protein
MKRICGSVFLMEFCGRSPVVTNCTHVLFSSIDSFLLRKRCLLSIGSLFSDQLNNYKMVWDLSFLDSLCLRFLTIFNAILISSFALRILDCMSYFLSAIGMCHLFNLLLNLLAINSRCFVLGFLRYGTCRSVMGHSFV